MKWKHLLLESTVLLGFIPCLCPAESNPSLSVSSASETTTIHNIEAVALSNQSRQPRSGVSHQDMPADQVPDVFRKAAPEDISDLIAMEQHTSRLIKKVRRCTVSVTIGRAKGSGVIISSDGYVLTAAHISIYPDSNVKVVLDGGEVVAGRALGANLTLDTGLVKLIDPANPRRQWPEARLANSDPASPGDWCVGVGHPGGQTIGRAGVIRLGRVINAKPWLIQTDCELSAGDSGGPLFDIAGRLVAVHSRIKAGLHENYHIPIELYRYDWDRLVAREVFHTGANLGVQGKPVARGLEITRVFPGQAADSAGLQRGDILNQFQGSQIDSIDDLMQCLSKERPGKIASLDIICNGMARTVDVELGLRRNRLVHIPNN